MGRPERERSAALPFWESSRNYFRRRIFETDLIAVAPILSEAGFHATFYVTAGFLDRPGHMSAAQLRALSVSGFEMAVTR